MPWIVAHKTLLCIDHEIVTAIAIPRLQTNVVLILILPIVFTAMRVTPF